MNADPLDDRLRCYSQQRPPCLTGPFNAEVWEEIDRRKRGRIRSRLLMAANWADLLREPALLVSAAGVAAAVGLVPAALAAARPDPRLVRQSLHLDVFSASPGPLFAAQASSRAAPFRR